MTVFKTPILPIFLCNWSSNILRLLCGCIAILKSVVHNDNHASHHPASTDHTSRESMSQGAYKSGKMKFPEFSRPSKQSFPLQLFS